MEPNAAPGALESEGPVIGAYLRELGRRLRAQRRPAGFTADVLAELAGGLADAAAKHRRAGLDPHSAQLRAVAEFGSARELADAYLEAVPVRPGPAAPGARPGARRLARPARPWSLGLNT
ncbi:permease prefix domain 1-containing protein [Allonocardiopsis opalescens]|uniref:Uncharacterized protein n=1 Tax=Allonocardiopsis opalescens TaxID=1144618 RepID=A0A2T0QAE5_9ACTN|nr:permease prefix domain 1-containing protein [Allonocardiopsis opalescens]PRY00886.1 hypothetical protein CLV72_102518 [Allonocardiopsis opalescens]